MKSVLVSVPAIVLAFLIAWYATGMIAYKTAWQKVPSQDAEKPTNEVAAVELTPLVKESFFVIWPRDLIKEFLVKMTVERLEMKGTDLTQAQANVTALKVYPFVITKITDDAASNTVINHLYFGDDKDEKPIYGLEKAAAEYFHRPFADLSAAEVATLAVISKSPARYNPHRNPENTDVVLRQKNYVLDELVRQNFLEKQAADLEKAKTLSFLPAQEAAPTPVLDAN